jgi:putative ABC transport system substrate-binding protein
MKRREFITLLGGSAALWPLVARAQRLFKIGLLDTGLGADFVVPFMGKLVELGYVEGKNAVIERKFAAWPTSRQIWCASKSMLL